MQVNKNEGKMSKIAYHGQVPFKGKEEVIMIKTPVGRHVLGKEERLLQSLSHQVGMPPTIMPKRGIIRDGHTIDLQYG